MPTPESQDAPLREMLSNYTPSTPVSGWEKIAASLDTSDRIFDEQVRQKVRQYTPPRHTDPWGEFLQRFTARKLFRTKLIVLKATEVAAVALLLLTFFQLEQAGRFQPYVPKPKTEAPLPAVAVVPSSTSGVLKSDTENTTSGTGIASAGSNAPVSVPSVKHIAKDQLQSESTAAMALNDDESNQVTNTERASLAYDSPPVAAVVSEEAEHAPVPSTLETIEGSLVRDDVIAAQTVNWIADSRIRKTTKASVPMPVFVKAPLKNFVQFGMLAQVDYNQLKMPGDRVSIAGKQEVFPLQGLTSAGYGGGFNLAVGNSILFVETGMVYSSKSFSPGRAFTLGEAEDVSNVELEAIRMQVISVPLQLRYHFERKGRLKAYAIAGFGLHLIAQSDIDLDVDYNFASLEEGEDPNNVPSLARTIRQTQIVSDGFRKKGSFKNHSYISANLGAGLEYALPDRKMIFAQTAYQYQIPNLRFSNHNGNHLLSVSFQAGVRAPLGS